MPRSQTPMGLAHAMAIRRPECCLPNIANVVGSHHTLLSGLNRAACFLAIYASQRQLPARHARLAFDWSANLTERDSHPQGSSRGFSFSSTSTSSSPKFLLAQLQVNLQNKP